MDVNLKVKVEGNLKSDGSGNRSWKGAGAAAGLELEGSWGESWASSWSWSWGGEGGREIFHFTALDFQNPLFGENAISRLGLSLEWLFGLGFYTVSFYGKCFDRSRQAAIQFQFSFDDFY